MPVPAAKLYLVEQSLRRRRASRSGAVSPALQAKAKVESDRREQQAAQQQLMMQAQALERMRRGV